MDFIYTVCHNYRNPGTPNFQGKFSQYAVSMIVDFCPAVFYAVCAASHLKGVVVNLASPGVS